jgi:hypothetical protein
MISNFNPTAFEQKVLNEARQLLGSNLAAFLLCSLGETQITHCRAFTAQSTDPHAENVHYQFEMVNESEQGLPIGRDPLVLAVLLNMLRERQPMHDKVTFRVSDILETLQWSQTTESQLLIKQAIEKYISTAYCLVDPTLSEEERSMNLYARFKRLIIGYKTSPKLLHVKSTDQQRFMQVQFWGGFLYAIKPRRKQFLGIEFQELMEMREIPC